MKDANKRKKFSYLCRRMKYLLSILCGLVLFTSCSKDDGEEPQQHAKRTVIAYMAAENTLSGYSQLDINEMIAGVKSISKYDNMIVFVDRANPNEKPFIIRLQNNDKQPADTIKKYEQDFYSSDPEKMKEVLQWVMTNYPADDYGLILWGHGDGWVIMKDSVATNRAFGVDNGDNKMSNQGLWMNIPSMRVALKALPHSFKFIFTDCCNMQNIEVAYELKDVTDYFIASPASIPDTGAPYDKIISDLFNYNDVQMYQKTCDDYFSVLETEDGHLPMAVIQSSQMLQLAQATKTILESIYNTDTAIDMDKLIYYWTYDSNHPDNTKERIMYDMNDFLLRHAQTADYQQWLKAYNQAVVYKKRSDHWQWHESRSYTQYADFEVTEERYGGVSMFVPLERYKETIFKYNELIPKLAWYHAVGWSELDW